ncbi:MAG: reductive dehalogenase domain-containing protein [Candidatus Thorarchaeota archaeon]|nr:reductive dehalogenase domain-containing protein [Candidatus Thorarchaeota archaeon]
MGIKRKLLVKIMDKIAIPRITKVIELENSTSQMPDMILPMENSPDRFNIPLEMIKLVRSNPKMPFRSLPPMRILPSLLGNMKKVVNSLPENPSNPQIEATPEFLEELVEFAHSAGVDVVGFAKLQREEIFKEKGILHDNAIVLAMEMDWDKMEQAPSKPTMNMIMETYNDLGIAANKIAEFLRKRGFSAMAGHPLGGMSLYTPLAMSAGIGWVGRNGLLITPEFGHRVRLAAVYTGISNLPLAINNNHSWISDYCSTCGICIRKCPTEAIREESIIQDSGRVTYTYLDKCFPYFVENYGCSICIKVCPFNRQPYSKIKERHDNG